MTPIEGAKIIENIGERVKDFPAWLITAFAVATGILLFVPAVNTDLPKAYRPPLVVALVAFGVLALFKWISLVVGALQASRASAKARKTFHATPITQQCHWSCSKQPDGSMSTQISAHLSVKNQSDAPLGLTTVRVISPKIRGDVLAEFVTVREPQGPYYHAAHESNSRIPPGTALPALALIIIGGLPRSSEERDLNVTLGIRDEDGNEQRVQALCKGRRTPKPSDKPIPLEALHEINDVTEKSIAAVLQSEISRYEQNGRQGGGLGSLHLLYRGSVMSAFGGDSWTVHSPENHELAADPETAAVRSDNLHALEALLARLANGEQRDRFANALLDRLDEGKGYAQVAYLIVCMLWKMGLLDKAIEAAKVGLTQGDTRTHGLSNVLLMFNGLLRYRYPDFTPESLDTLERFVRESGERSFRIPQKIAAIRARRLLES